MMDGPEAPPSALYRPQKDDVDLWRNLIPQRAQEKPSCVSSKPMIYGHIVGNVVECFDFIYIAS
jgi:hypothetical protein